MDRNLANYQKIKNTLIFVTSLVPVYPLNRRESQCKWSTLEHFQPLTRFSSKVHKNKT